MLYKGLGDIGSFGSSACKLSQSVCEIPVENKFGLYDGNEAIASISPVSTSTATAAPLFAFLYPAKVLSPHSDT